MVFSLLNSYLSKGNFLNARVIGNSMRPLIPKYSNVKIINKSRYCFGDVVLFYDEGFLMIHRIIKKNKDLIVTKGDAFFFCDKELYNDKILGKVVEVDGKSLESVYHKILGVVIAIISRQFNNIYHVYKKWS